MKSKETDKMMNELKRELAHHCWKRAIAIRGNKCPRFEAPTEAPGCKNDNRFVSMKQMMSKALKKQP